MNGLIDPPPTESDPLTSAIIGAAIEVHKTLGPGLLESIYEDCLCAELRSRGLRVERQVELPIVYKGLLIDGTFRIDILVEDTVIVELKAVERVLPVHQAQLLTYLKLSGKKTGLLMNFNDEMLAKSLVRRRL